LLKVPYAAVHPACDHFVRTFIEGNRSGERIRHGGILAEFSCFVIRNGYFFKQNCGISLRCLETSGWNFPYATSRLPRGRGAWHVQLAYETTPLRRSRRRNSFR